MSRYLYPILFIAVLGAPFLLREMIGGAAADSAHRGAQRRLVIITPHAEGIRREYQAGFSAWLAARGEPDVEIDYRGFGGASDIVKYFESSAEMFSKTGSYNIDLVWGGGENLFESQLKRPGFLAQVTLPRELMSGAFPTPDIGGVALYDKDNYWFGTALSSFGIVYNKDVLRYLGLPEPKTWANLADPRYRGWLVLADPTRSSSAKLTFMTIVERSMADAQEHKTSIDAGWARGVGLVRLICSNVRVFADASGAVPGMVGRGDAAAGMAIDFYGRTEVEFIGADRVGYVEPAGATVVNPDPIAMVKGAPNPKVAQLFIEYVLSDAGQKLWNYRPGVPGGPRSTALRRLPIRRSTYTDQTFFTDKVNPFTISASFNTRRDRTRTFSIIGELLQVSCIDLLAELRATREAILASPRAAELDAAFALFPIDQKEALDRLKRYSGTKEAPTPPLQKLALLRSWTQEFKAEYARYRQTAQ